VWYPSIFSPKKFGWSQPRPYRGEGAVGGGQPAAFFPPAAFSSLEAEPPPPRGGGRGRLERPWWREIVLRRRPRTSVVFVMCCVVELSSHPPIASHQSSVEYSIFLEFAMLFNSHAQKRLDLARHSIYVHTRRRIYAQTLDSPIVLQPWPSKTRWGNEGGGVGVSASGASMSSVPEFREA